MDLSLKLSALRSWLADKGCIAIAYSGGLDSSFLASVSVDVLGDFVLGVILDSPAFPRHELARAIDIASKLGLRVRIVDFPILKEDAICKNDPNRCYLCKKLSATILLDVAIAEGIETIADGVNLSDYSDYRPGIKAWDEAGIEHPLAIAGFDKGDIRAAAKAMNLSFWDLPSSACLASRFSFGDEITVEGLRRVELAEDFLRSFGFRQLRVRSYGDLASIEVAKESLPDIFDLRSKIVSKLKLLGFTHITLDLEGYRTGSMNPFL